LIKYFIIQLSTPSNSINPPVTKPTSFVPPPSITNPYTINPLTMRTQFIVLAKHQDLTPFI